jgi:hypothetical protein
MPLKSIHQLIFVVIYAAIVTNWAPNNDIAPKLKYEAHQKYEVHKTKSTPSSI